MSVPGVIKPAGALSEGIDAIGVGGGLLLLVALLHGKALEVGVPLPVEVPLLPHAASNMASKTKTPTTMMLLGVCRSRLLCNKVSIEKPPLVNDYRFWKQIRCNAVITQVQARSSYFFLLAVPVCNYVS